MVFVMVEQSTLGERVGGLFVDSVEMNSVNIDGVFLFVHARATEV